MRAKPDYGEVPGKLRDVFSSRLSNSVRIILNEAFVLNAKIQELDPKFAKIEIP